MAQNLVLNILAKDKTRVAFNGIKAGLSNLRNSIFSDFEPPLGPLSLHLTSFLHLWGHK